MWIWVILGGVAGGLSLVLVYSLLNAAARADEAIELIADWEKAGNQL